MYAYIYIYIHICIGVYHVYRILCMYIYIHTYLCVFHMLAALNIRDQGYIGSRMLGHADEASKPRGAVMH